MSPAREELSALEAAGTFVFHGTDVDEEALEPRQAVDTKTGPDGPPAVFASDRADYAVFMAIVNARNCPGGSQSRAGGNPLRFGMTRDTFARLRKDASGLVYVFNKNEFEQREDSAEFLTTNAVTPVRKIRVGREDLPGGIGLYG